jgi:hypothetical protein
MAAHVRSSKPKVVSIQRQNEKGRMQKPALAPALSPRRGRIVRRSFENVYDWIGRTLIRKTRNKRKPFPLLGERMKGEGGRKHPFQ